MRSILFALLLFCFLISVAGQTRKPPKRKTAAPKTESSDKTRERRTGQPSTSEPTPASELKPESTPATVPSPEPVKVEEQTKTVEESKAAEKNEPAAGPESTPTAQADPIEELRKQIDSAATTSERVRLQLKLVEEFASTGKKTEALSELHTIVNTDVFDPQGFYNVGNTSARLNDNDDAIQAYRKAIDQRKGRYSRALNNLGVVFLRLGRWDESHNALIAALKLENFRYAEASYNLGRLYEAQGQSDLAVREWRRVLAINPEHTAAADALARIATADRIVVQPNRNSTTTVNPNKIIAPEVKPSVKSAPSGAGSLKTLTLDQSSFTLLQQARSASEKGNTQVSIDSYQRLLSKQNGYFPPANLELSFALMSVKRYDDAMSNLKMVAERDGTLYPISYFHLARVYELKGDLKQAESFFSQAVTTFGAKNSQFLLDVSRVREKQGDFKGALEAMERYIAEMQKQGQEPSWSEERLAALRQKVSAVP